MGWMYGTNAQGREVGYGIEATCDEPGCTEKIDRGLAYVCGGMHDGGEYGCGHYYCSSHLYGDGLCKRCKDNARCPSCAGTGHLSPGSEEECLDCDGLGDRELER